MLTLIALSAALMQDPPAPPHAPPAPGEVRTRVMMMGPGGSASLDKDGDGQVSREEFAAPMNDHFARMDKDGDGRLSTEELSSGHGGGDHDVMIMRRPGGPGERHMEVRTLGEGAAWVDGESGDKRTAVFIGGPAGPGEEREIIIRGPGGAHVIHAPAGGEWTEGERRVEINEVRGPGEMDKDGDGKISEAEFTAPLREAFTNMDADRSGFIEEGERGAGRNVHVFTQRIETREESDQ